MTETCARIVNLGDDVAVIGHALGGAQSALQKQPAWQPGVQSQINGIVVLVLVPVFLRQRQVSVVLTHFRWVEVEQPADLLTAAPGQPCIRGRPHTVGIVVCGSDGQIVEDGEIAVDSAEVPESR